MIRKTLHFAAIKTRLLLLYFICISSSGSAQQVSQPVPGAPVTLQNTPQRDTANKTNTAQWRSEQARITFRKLHSKRSNVPDTQIHSFHRRPFQMGWNRDLGNLGSPITSLLFRPEHRVGPTLGYHTFDPYRFQTDSLNFYNTNRPYSVFTYQLGSRAEQMARLLHTQNIQPDWNVAVQYRKISSQGNYKVQRTNHDMGSLTSGYKSKNKHYELNLALVYNKIQNDENGGIVSDSFLTLESFDDRRTIPVRFQNDAYSNRRSSVTTLQRDFTALLVHRYIFGRSDTLYNEDSTHFTHTLTPRVGVSHRFQFSTEKYQFKDLRPDSLRYTGFFEQNFGSEDSVFTEQKWFYVDNALMLNGYLGKEERQVTFAAGLGNRIDQFRTAYGNGSSREQIISNYLVGELKKEALSAGQWFYDASAKFFVTGTAAGSLLLQARAGKHISRRMGSLSAGFEQRVNQAPYSYQVYQNNYHSFRKDFNKETITLLYATIQNDPLKLDLGIKNYLIANYFFLNGNQRPDQYADAFNLTQLWLKKTFSWRIWVLENDLLYQQPTRNAPINLPAVAGRHQLSIETHLFGNALKIATGIDARWHSSYASAGYSPFFGRFYFQDTYRVNNAPEMALFFNFRIKSFRAYVMGDQLQTFFARNVINAPGYPAQDAMIRFGFNWVLVN